MSELRGLFNLSLTQSLLKEAGLTYELTSEQFERVRGFFERRAEWSKTHNLSGPQALATLSTDLIDAVAVERCLEPSLPLIDIGSGSGVPGLLIACLSPERVVRIVEPLAKRVAFMKTVAYQLRLRDVQVFRERWPSQKVGALGEAQLISRAVVSPEEWPHLAQEPCASQILQMLAHKRPEWPLQGYELSAEQAYAIQGGGARLVRRWRRLNSPELG
jgi:16S rRNA (guanine527-N7)-methyltransferase